MAWPVIDLGFRLHFQAARPADRQRTDKSPDLLPVPRPDPARLGIL